MRVYVASRVRHAPWWRYYRDECGWDIISTWIDEAGEGQTADMSELWARITDEVRRCDGLLLFAEAADFPLKGALVEAGMAIALGKPVAVVIPDGFDGESFQPIGSWIRHPLCRTFATFVQAKRWLDGLTREDVE